MPVGGKLDSFRQFLVIARYGQKLIPSIQALGGVSGEPESLRTFQILRRQFRMVHRHGDSPQGTCAIVQSPIDPRINIGHGHCFRSGDTLGSGCRAAVVANLMSPFHVVR